MRVAVAWLAAPLLRVAIARLAALRRTVTAGLGLLRLALRGP
ncbi:hypothetical protein NQP46_12125 [Streptomyces albus]|nr:hypothetical protein NQP46_12125 [Streptomyces albus]